MAGDHERTTDSHEKAEGTSERAEEKVEGPCDDGDDKVGDVSLVVSQQLVDSCYHLHHTDFQNLQQLQR